MKLHLPKLLRTALTGLAAAAAPFALTVATVSSVVVFAGVAQAEDLDLSENQRNVGANTHYGTVTVSGTETSTIAFTSNNKNLIIDSLSIAGGASLTITAHPCDLVVVKALSGAGDLTLNRPHDSSNWGHSLTLKGDNSGYTGIIHAINADTAGNATQVYLMAENSAKNAVIDLGDYTTLGVSTETARIAGLTGTGSHAAVISFANPNLTQGEDGLSINTDGGANGAGNCYNQNISRNVNDETLRTLVLNGSGQYSYAGCIGSETNADKLNLTVALETGSSQTLSGTNYINDLTVTSGDLVLSGTTTVSATIENNGTLSFGPNGSLAIADPGGFDRVGGLTYSDAVSGSSQNGYVNASYIVVRGAGEVIGLDNVTLHGATYGLTTDGEGNRVMVLAGTGGDYYVNEGTVVYGGSGDDANNAASEATTGIVLNGGDLTMTQNLKNGVDISLAADGTVSLGASEVTLSKGNIMLNGHTLNLDGNGTYQIGNSTAADKISLADGWTGTIELESGTLGSITHGNSALNIKKVGAGTAVIDGTHATDISNLDIQAGTVELSAGDTGYSFGSVTIGESATLKLGGLGAVLANNTQVTMKGESSLLMDCCRAYGYATAINTDITVDAEGSYVSIKGSLYGNGVDLSGSIGGSGELRFMNGNGSNSFTVSAVIGDTLSVKLDKANSTLYLSGTNTYTGGTEVTAGRLEVSGNGTLGTGTVSVSGSGELILRNEALTVAGLVLSGGGSVTVEENLTLTGASTLVYDQVTLKAGKSITIGEGGSLTSDGITYGNGATLTRGTNDGGLSAFHGGYSVTEGDISINAGQDNNNREISMVINGGNVVSNVSGTLTLKNDATMGSFVGGKTTIEGNATINGTATFKGNSSITGDAEFGGLTTLEANLTVAGDTTLSTTDARIAIGEGKTFSTDSGKLQVTGTAGSTSITTSADNAGVNASNEAITISNAEVTVNSEEGYTLDAKLSGSTLANTGAGTATVKVAEGSTNDFNASRGSVAVDAQAAAVGNLTVGNEKSVTIGDGTGTATVSGTAALENGSTVGGNVTIADSGRLEIFGTGFSADGFGAMVEGTLTANADAVSLVNRIDVTDIMTSTTYVLATALGMDITGVFTAENFYTGTLAEGMTVSVSVQPMGSGAYAVDMATASQLLLILTAENPGTLTQTAVAENGVSVTGTNITLTVTDNLDGVTGGFNVTVGEEAWQAIVDGMAPSGGIYQNATVTLTGADGATLDLATYTGGAVTLNKYAGTGTQGEYFVAYIPEPATATLSLLVLAALAARRRRK